MSLAVAAARAGRVREAAERLHAGARGWELTLLAAPALCLVLGCHSLSLLPHDRADGPPETLLKIHAGAQFMGYYVALLSVPALLAL